MNPYHQPQNNSPYGQSPAYNQPAGPNKYPTLPPMQNPQYPPQSNPYNAQARPGDYLPPAQYGNVQAQASNERERQEVMEKMKQNEKGFDSCFLTFYKFWLWFLCIASFGASAYYLWLAAQKNPYNFDVLWVIFSILLGWVVIQSVFGLMAMAQRSLRKANITCVMMMISLIPILFLDVWFIIVLAQYPYPRPPPQHDWAPIYRFFIGALSTQALIHAAVSMNGAFKVKKILIEREVLQEKLQEIDYSFRA